VFRIPARVQTSCEVHPASFSISSRAFICMVKPPGRAFSIHIRLVPSLRISGAIPPLPIWFEKGQLKFNILREIKMSLGRFKSK